MDFQIDRLGLTDADRTAAHADLFADFVAIVRRLRRECPWDREQTHDSVKHLSIEEVYELVEAIDRGDPEALREELGDLFLHVLFHSHIAETDGTFTLEDVMCGEMEKLIRRHPHVFGDVAVADTGEVLRNWEEIKKAEREREKGDGFASVLDGVPAALPALLRAERAQEKAAAVGFDFPNGSDAFGKVREEIEELREAAESGAHPDALRHEFGDVLFALVNVARFWGVVPENALRETLARFTRRFQYAERKLAEDGRSPQDSSLEEMDVLWEEAKTLE